MNDNNINVAVMQFAMFSKCLDILKSVLPVILSSMGTFIVTKYTHHRNIPLDKMEIAYNRVYYPIYRLMSIQDDFKKINLDIMIPKISFYLNKCEKYVDKSTLKAFRILSKERNKDAYENLKNNIWNKDAYLRRRLGYLEPNIWQVYIYSSKNEKFLLRFFLETLSGYAVAMIGTMLGRKGKEWCVAIIIVIIAIIVCELMYKGIGFIRSKIRK